MGSGSPSAADSPITKMRSVPGCFCAGITNGVARRSMPAGKNGAVNSGFSQNPPSQRTVKPGGAPKPAMRSTPSTAASAASGSSATDTSRNAQTRKAS